MTVQDSQPTASEPELELEIGGYRLRGAPDRREGGSLLFDALGPDGESAALQVTAEPLAGRRTRARFRKLARARADLKHPALLPVRSFGEESGRPYVVTDPRPAGSLVDLVRAGPVDPELALRLMRSAAEGLTAGHKAGLVHLALGAESLLLEGERLQLDLFGVFRATGQVGWGDVVRRDPHLRYASPEGIRGEELSPASNVYSLTALIVHALTGAPPFAYRDPMLIEHAHLSEAPPRPSEKVPGLPPTLDEVVARGMAKNPAERPAGPTALVAQAERALGDRGAPREAARPAPQVAAPSLRREPGPAARREPVTPAPRREPVTPAPRREPVTPAPREAAWPVRRDAAPPARREPARPTPMFPPAVPSGDVRARSPSAPSPDAHRLPPTAPAGSARTVLDAWLAASAAGAPTDAAPTDAMPAVRRTEAARTDVAPSAEPTQPTSRRPAPPAPVISAPAAPATAAPWDSGVAASAPPQAPEVFRPPLSVRLRELLPLLAVVVVAAAFGAIVGMPGSTTEPAPRAAPQPDARTVARLDEVRLRLRDDLAAATTPAEQASTAERLADAHATAAEGARSPELKSAAETAASAYTALAAAAQSGDEDEFSGATADVETADDVLARTLRSP